MRNNSRFSSLFFIIDLFILNISFFAVNYWRRGTLKITPSYYIKLLIAFYGMWLFISLVTKKFKANKYKTYRSSLLLCIRSNIYITYLVSLLIVFEGLVAFSRRQIFGTCILLFVLEVVFISAYFVTTGKYREKLSEEIDIKSYFKSKISIFLLFSDFALISLSFFIVNLYKRGTINLLPEYEKAMVFIYGVWFVSSFVTLKFDKRNFSNFYNVMIPCIKAFVMMFAIMSVLMFAFRLFYFSRLQIFGSFLLLIVFEIALYYLYFVLRYGRKENGDIESFKEVRALFKQEELPFEKNKVHGKTRVVSSVLEVLRDKYLQDYPRIFHLVENAINLYFIDSAIDLTGIDKSEIAVMDTPEIYNVKVLDDHSIKLLINLHRINDVRWINRYLLEVHRKLAKGGYLVGRADTIALHKKRFFKKYPQYFREVFYVLNFILVRVFPKLPGIKKIYFVITKGKNRVISRAEILGRLYFCGFKIVKEQEIENNLYYLAQGAKTPSLDQSPSYGPLVELKRIGLNGQVLNIHKFRTMYPYSEFLQDYIYELQKLKEGGKIKDDFRVTGWGRIMRKLWLDELPMVYNWIRGEVKLFGVRPLSMHYLSLYNKPLREIRKTMKPGIVPPFYADLPKTFEDICKSEEKYIQKYKMHPLRTQWIYFWKALKNIVFEGARSN